MAVARMIVRSGLFTFALMSAVATAKGERLPAHPFEKCEGRRFDVEPTSNDSRLDIEGGHLL